MSNGIKRKGFANISFDCAMAQSGFTFVDFSKIYCKQEQEELRRLLK